MIDLARPGANEDGSPAEVRRRFEEFVRWSIEKEWSDLSPRLSAEQREAFHAYYRLQLAHAFSPSCDRYVRALWRGETGWVARWIASRSGRGAGPGGVPRVLDAGSGFGTFAMLFAALGADVVGIDLREDRVQVALTRLEALTAKGGARLPLKLDLASVTDRLGGPFDLIWTYNALSHIDPPADFLSRARESLADGGVLVVADINGAHPAHRRRLGALRSEVRQSWTGADGEAHRYAVERTFTPGELRRLFEHTGFRVTHHEVLYLSPTRLPGLVSERLVRPLQRFVRAGSWFARRQFLVADVPPVGRFHPVIVSRGVPS